VPLDYRREIRGKYDWIAEGVARYRSHPATQAALKLTVAVLEYQPSHGFSYQRELQRYLQRLTYAGITAEQVLVRVCELCAHIERHRGRFESQRCEDAALGRCVIYLAPIRAGEKPPSVRVMVALAGMLRDACYPFAVSLLRRLEQDADERHELKKLAGSLVAP